MPPQELPKISSITQFLATPEIQFESLVKEALKVELPPGPQSTLLKLQTSLEAGKAPSPEAVVPKLPEIVSKLPTLPKLEDILPGVEKRGKYQLSGAEEEKPKIGYVMSR